MCVSSRGDDVESVITLSFILGCCEQSNHAGRESYTMLMLEAMIDMGGNLKTIILDGCEVSIKTEPEPKLTTHHRPGEMLL